MLLLRQGAANHGRRPEFEPPWIGRPHVTALTLDRLGQREIANLIDHLTGNKPLPKTIRQDIIERTDGIPLFVEEMTKAVLESKSKDEGQQTTAAWIVEPGVTVALIVQTDSFSVVKTWLSCCHCAHAWQDDNFAFARLIFRKAAVAAVFFVVPRLYVAPEIRTIDFTGFSYSSAGICEAIASRILWLSTNAVLYWTPRSRVNWSAEWPFAPFIKIAMAARMSRISPACGSQKSFVTQKLPRRACGPQRYTRGLALALLVSPVIYYVTPPVYQWPPTSAEPLILLVGGDGLEPPTFCV